MLRDEVSHGQGHASDTPRAKFTSVAHWSEQMMLLVTILVFFEFCDTLENYLGSNQQLFDQHKCGKDRLFVYGTQASRFDYARYIKLYCTQCRDFAFWLKSAKIFSFHAFKLLCSTQLLLHLIYYDPLDHGEQAETLYPLLPFGSPQLFPVA